jgi:O-antigen ligase
MTTEHEELIDAPPAGEQIHMPAPSILPILNAVGLSLAIVGITISPIFIVAGLLLFVVTTIVWIGKARHEMEELPLDHHSGH